MHVRVDYPPDDAGDTGATLAGSAGDTGVTPGRGAPATRARPWRAASRRRERGDRLFVAHRRAQ